MDFKKKLGVGIVTGVMGLSLVGGGTYAAFNDIEVIDNQFAAGELNLDVSNLDDEGHLFRLSNLKPGDTMTREFTITNGGSLAIQHVLMHMDVDGFQEGEVNGNGFSGSNDDYKEFLKQFEIQFFEVVDHDKYLPLFKSVLDYEHEWFIPKPWDDTASLSLYDFYEGNLDTVRDQHVYTKEDHEQNFEGTEAWINKDRINLAPEIKDYLKGWITVEEAGLHAIEAGQSKDIVMTIKFIDDRERQDGDGNDGLYTQNKFQNNSIDVDFYLEATQWHGIDVGSENGYVGENEKNNPEDQD
ncbi:TasA family protein [Alkalibacillus haloalkaliphilus]|uniref:Spore coat-associated protein N n=1 Tax=Alkalibacillus haloalkaliphilus TaxID=94136 RepID=A0A511VZR8_9BACI|nr:TasA family protein [Alkalibacillus haloalkaliphilus]GEN44337.1 spore coat-associated protein N [Alkalibacillus haloalkaliphilus]